MHFRKLVFLQSIQIGRLFSQFSDLLKKIHDSINKRAAACMVPPARAASLKLQCTAVLVVLQLYNYNVFVLVA